jgi:hypothetical protein
VIRLIALHIKGGEDDAYVEADLNERELELLAIKTEIEERVCNLRSHTENVKSIVHNFTLELKSVYRSESNYLEELQRELRELASQSGEEQNQNDESLIDDFMNNSAFQEIVERTRKHNEEMSEKKHEKKSSGIKRLFKLIAAKAHPDKTKQEHLHKLFIMAREAYDNNDFPKLEKIFKCIISRTTWAFLRLEEEIEILQEQEQLTSMELQAVASSIMFQVMRDYRTGTPHLVKKASNFFVSDLNEQIERTLSQIRHLDPTRYGQAGAVETGVSMENIMATFFGKSQSSNF